MRLELIFPGSARASRAGDGVLAIANFIVSELFGEAPKRAREGACAPQKLHRGENAS